MNETASSLEIGQRPAPPPGGARFRHSGDLGDIIFALPAVRALGGGVLYLDPEGGRDSPMVRPQMGRRFTNLTAEAIKGIAPILLQQEYVREVRPWAGEAVDYDLDLFRRHKNLHNISDSHLKAFGLDSGERDRAWLTIADPIVIEGRPIVISRSVRYHGNYAFWKDHLPLIKDRSVFVGYPKEHDIFQYTFGYEVQYYPTPDMLTLARVIAGCGHFMGNQGFPHALAEGMKKNLINEVFRPNPAAVFKRAGADYV